MGFFSKMKKWWATEEAVKTEESVDQPQPESPSQAGEPQDSPKPEHASALHDDVAPKDQTATSPESEPERIEPAPERIADDAPHASFNAETIAGPERIPTPEPTADAPDETLQRPTDAVSETPSPAPAKTSPDSPEISPGQLPEEIPEEIPKGVLGDALEETRDAPPAQAPKQASTVALETEPSAASPEAPRTATSEPEDEPTGTPHQNLEAEPEPDTVLKPLADSTSESSAVPDALTEDQPAAKTRQGLFARLFSRKPAKPVSPPKPKLTPRTTSEPRTTTAPESPIEPGRTPGAPAWQAQLMQALRGAEPKLSVWLEHTLSGVETMGDELWDRLRFLFQALEAPEDEAELFITKFRDWLEDMGYEHVGEFRSELQYRLALALELEDEEDERDRLFLKLSAGLNKTREQLTRRIDALLSAHRTFDDPFWEELEEVLIMADVGHRSAVMLLDRLKARVRKEQISEPEAFREMLRQELAAIFPSPKAVDLTQGPEVVLVVGVNGVGKTTTIAKLAHRAQMQGRKVLVAAGDTFRAAAMEQLGIWAKRTGADFFSKGEGADPAAVAYEAVDAALQGGHDVVFLDTAGRLHTKVDLMDELRKIKRVLAKKLPGAPHRSLLVVDATTGQNALSQTKLFHEAVSVDEIILTKLDGTSKGGIVVAIALEFDMPISFVGLGEKMEDLRPFSGEDFAKALVN
ncbi:MAG: signal recognition particle-docking protein FtsY [Desulfovibrionales bacterium]|nr:MAG: signal recognition particle-docking protein FtsY [Desulfovibrionales bacterium]